MTLQDQTNSRSSSNRNPHDSIISRVSFEVTTLPQLSSSYRVSAISRRQVTLIDPDGNSLKVRIPGQFDKIIVGDIAIITKGKNKQCKMEVLPRKNCVSRTFGTKEKKIAANVDLILAITAPPPLFNPVFIDRLVAASWSQDITCAIVLNKSDLDYSSVENLLEYYHNLGIHTIYTSALRHGDITEIEKTLSLGQLKTVVLAGVSGVGKSTILNRLVPEANRPTSRVIEKSGQGRQTTSLAVGYSCKRANKADLFLIDLPGIQEFGIGQVPQEDVIEAFPEFAQWQEQCAFANCIHMAEPICGVKEAVREGHIPLSRYESYMHMLAEIAYFERARGRKR